MPIALRRRRLAVLLALLFALPAAADFPPLTDAERALTAVPFEPNAPAVVLLEKAHMKIQEFPNDFSSILDVAVRLKILREEGKSYGEVEIPHNRVFRLSGFKGRTVLPDGRVVPLPDAAVFEQETSRSARQYVTKAAFAQVEVGAILEYSYTLRWDSLFFLEPWLFSRELPVLHGEITYLVPPNLAVKPWGRALAGAKLNVAHDRVQRGTSIRAWIDNVPAVPDEPYTFPRNDLSSRFLLLATEVAWSGGSMRLFASWDETCDFFAGDYEKFQRPDRNAKKTARDLVARAQATSPRDKARAVHAFVRDEVATAPGLGVWVGDRDVDAVLADRRGDAAEKALLLASMLDAVGVPPRLVWATERSSGRVDLELANPWWFDTMLVAVDLDGGRVFLDPSLPSLGFGRLAAGFEGMPALLFARRKPETVTLPTTPFEAHARRARLELAVDGEGRVGGRGTLALTGHRARAGLAWRGGDQPTAERWQEWLAGAFPGYAVGDVTAVETVEEQRVEVAWSLSQSAEGVLGDEVSVLPARPLGPVSQPFALPVEKRRTPVLLDHGDRDEVEVVVTWPESWSVDVAPAPVVYRGKTGELEATTEVDAAARKLVYRRRFDITGNEWLDTAGYESIRGLYAAVERHDAEPIVLVGP